MNLSDIRLVAYDEEPTAKPRGLLVPHGPQVHVRIVESQKVSSGGIHIPETARKKPLEAVVLRVGPGWRDDNGQLHTIDLAPGERVMFGRYAGTELENDRELMLRDSDVLAVIGTDGESIRAHQDNLVVRLAPQRSLSNIIELKETKAKSRRAQVLVSGKGYYTRTGAFIETEITEGMEVMVEATAGQDFAPDFDVIRENKGASFDELFGHAGEFRIVRADEVICVVRDEEGN